MTLDEQPRGHQQPRISHTPPSVSSAGREAIELAAHVGLHLDPWQQLVLEGALGETIDGLWSAYEVGLIVSRQNGKGAILEARELAGLLLFGEKVIVHTAHEYKTAHEAFLRISTLIDGSAWLRKRVKAKRVSHGEQGYEMTNGARLMYAARSKGSGRGFSGDLIVLDEAYNLSSESVAALTPTTLAMRNPQIWYASTAGDRDVAPCDQLADIRRRGIAGTDDSIAFYEWSAHYDSESGKLTDDPNDPATWAWANPGMGIRLAPSRLAKAHRSMPAGKFATEILGVGHWPFPEGNERVISEHSWNACEQVDSEIVERLSISLDITPERGSASIAAAGRNAEGHWHVEVIEHKAGTQWLVPRLAELVRRNDPTSLPIDVRSAAGSIIRELDEAQIPFTPINSSEMGQACGAFYDAARDGTLRHLGQPSLDNALRGAERRNLGDVWVWNRRSTGVDITPLIACTVALRGAMAHSGADYDPLASFF